MTAEIYDADNEIEFNLINEIFMNSLRNEGLIPETDNGSYSDMQLTCKLTNKIAIVIEPIYRDVIISSLTEIQRLKIRIIDTDIDFSYFN